MKNQFISENSLNTAVLFLVFNRLNTTKQVFEAIKKAKPPRLYIAADGARKTKIGEEAKVKEVRDHIMSQIDWECEVNTLFRDENLGCKIAVSSAIDWFFENEEQGIILEDDCLPSQSFFWFCEDLLNKYKDDMRIFLISGYNKQNEWKSDEYSYFFSYFGGIWGWASWADRWKYYDVEAKNLNKFIEFNGFEKLMGPKLGKLRQQHLKNMTGLNTWDYQWAYTRHEKGALACVPVKSLIENIGFGEEATHTFGENRDNVKAHEIDFPLKNPEFMVPDKEYDFKFLGQVSLITRIRNKLKVLFK